MSSDSVQDTELAANNWVNLHALIQADPLRPGPAPTLFEALPPGFLSYIYFAHAKGCSSALGSPQQPTIPMPAAASALYAYFSQGFQYTLQQRLTLTASPPIHAPPQEPRDTIGRGKEPDTFDGSNRD